MSAYYRRPLPRRRRATVGTNAGMAAKAVQAMRSIHVKASVPRRFRSGGDRTPATCSTADSPTAAARPGIARSAPDSRGAYGEGHASQSDHVARVRFGRTVHVSETVRRLAQAIPHRRTNGRPFSNTSIPKEVLAELVDSTAVEGGRLAVADPATREAVLSLVRLAERRERDEPAYWSELADWTGGWRDRRDGVYAGGVRAVVRDGDRSDPRLRELLCASAAGLAPAGNREVRVRTAQRINAPSTTRGGR